MVSYWSNVRRVALLVAVDLVASSTSPFHANQTTPRPPLIDMHAHFTAENGPRIMDALNIRYVLLTGDREGFAKLKTIPQPATLQFFQEAAIDAETPVFIISLESTLHSSYTVLRFT